MEQMFKDDFVEALTEHYGYEEDEAEKLWAEHGSKYCTRVYDRMSDLIQQIIGE